MKWNKLDTNFLVYSAVISVIAIVIGLYFYPYQINEDYLHISLNEEAAKYKAEQYINSRGWDISGYTFTCKYSQNHNDQFIHNRNTWLNQNYIKENITNKNKEKIKEIDRLAGANRWNMRWYQPPNKDEIKISYTKDGDLTYFAHIIPDTLSGDTLPEE